MSWIKSKVRTALRRNDDSAMFDRLGQVEMFAVMQGAAYDWHAETKTQPPQDPKEITYGTDLEWLFMEPRLFREDLLSQLDKPAVGLERISRSKGHSILTLLRHLYPGFG